MTNSALYISGITMWLTQGPAVAAWVLPARRSSSDIASFRIGGLVRVLFFSRAYDRIEYETTYATERIPNPIANPSVLPHE